MSNGCLPRLQVEKMDCKVQSQFGVLGLLKCLGIEVK